ncbi:phosphoenolpyruvate--protein phosphotransferase [Marinobacterium sp. D7]|uniref:phosphoenolpyruvate--protein phosphotransferase n=1 Tax=Marinobacterium ramblicola TaxID=2849041 RepID=UPI001C2D8E2E|nr:phosphoenolpyruvate--protein phosphotransferase [Marinobacterium ramblicola]MBV1789546.1 phosphoenolpyruvate--protein phosphotransferase [Marinobacterium ramblicola]
MPHPLATLTALVEQIARTQDPATIMETIVQRLRELLEVEVCSIYLCTPERDALILASTQGLSDAAVGKVRLAMNEGLVGHIAATLSAVNLADAPSDDRFVYIPETHEKPYHRFLGVPLLHLRKLVGVLVIQGHQRKPFSDEDEAFLITVASQLGSTLYQLHRDGKWMSNLQEVSPYRRYTGIKGAPGVGQGRLWLIHPHLSLADVKQAMTSNPAQQKSDFADALEAVREELESGSGKLGQHLPADVRALFHVYELMLQSPELSEGVLRLIDGGASADWALKQTVDEMASMFEQSSDPYMQARSEDIRNIGQRILNQILARDQQVLEAPDEELILAGDLISIADLASFPQQRIRGLLCTAGSTLSHTAIVANALGIPAVMGVEGFEPEHFRGARVIVDGNRAECMVNPPPALMSEYKRMIDQEQRFMRDLDRLRDMPAETLDGVRIKLLTNTGLLADATPGLQRGAEGVGLYRSEIPFMIHDSFPTEQEQYRIYSKVLKAYAPRPVSMRTLDIGGDKQLPYFEINESNPYLGWRGIRFTLDNTQLLVSQIRAMLRAHAEHGNLKLLVPMISRVDEIKTVRELVEKAAEALKRDGVEVGIPEIGMMIEVPSAMLLLPKLAPYIDFVSVGSNDLTQYLLAVDRNNPRVSNLFDNMHPAMLVALEQIVGQCRQLKLPVSLCGEMASDPVAVLMLVALGYDCLSLSAYNIPKIKLLIRSLRKADLLPLLERAHDCSDETQIRALFAPVLERLGWSSDHRQPPESTEQPH